MEMRRDRRRVTKRLEEKGPLEFLRLQGGAEAGAFAANAIPTKNRWLKDRGLVSSALSISNDISSPASRVATSCRASNTRCASVT